MVANRNELHSLNFVKTLRHPHSGMINLKPSGKRETETRLASYPAWGYPLETGEWRIHLSGVAWLTPVVFTRRQKLMIRMLGNVMKASPEEMASEVFNDRVTPFMAEAGNRLCITATIGDRTFALKKRTRRNGHFRNWLTVPAELLRLLFLRRAVPNPFCQSSFRLPIPMLPANWFTQDFCLIEASASFPISTTPSKIRQLATAGSYWSIPLFAISNASKAWQKPIDNGQRRASNFTMFPQVRGSFFSLWFNCRKCMSCPLERCT